MTDLELIRAYLNGHITTTGATIVSVRRKKAIAYDAELSIKYHVSYLKPKSAEERTARSQLAALLRTGDVPPDILSAIADLIDPEERIDSREFIGIKHRGSGRPSRLLYDGMLAQRISDLRSAGRSVEAAIETLAEKTGLATETLWSVWKRDKKRSGTETQSGNR